MKLESSTKLRLRDIIVIRLSDVQPEEEEALTELATNLSMASNVPIIILQNGMEITSISESDMKRMGWVRDKPEQAVVSPDSPLARSSS